MQSTKNIITLDGGAATGKSTVMVRLSTTLGWHGVSTGHVYRAATVLALSERIVPESAAIELTERLRSGALTYHPARHRYSVISPEGEPRELSLAELSTPSVSAATPQYSRIPEVRAALLDFQRGLYREPGLVADGRDCGTVVYPEAPLKIWLEVDAVEAARRLCRSYGQPFEAAYVDVLERNRADRRRGTAPMLPADDAVRIDTTHLTAEEVYGVVLELVRRHGLVG
jgi:cytidylate kinase